MNQRGIRDFGWSLDRLMFAAQAVLCLYQDTYSVSRGIRSRPGRVLSGASS